MASKHVVPVVLRHARGANRLPLAALAHPLRLTFDELGGAFIKFGQIVASAPGLFGEAVSEEFRSCLDTGPPVLFAEVCRRIEDDLGAPVNEVFAELDPEPIGRASIAVVHRARLHDGRAVAVKVLRPGIDRVIATDVDLMLPFFELLARQTGDQMAGSMLQVFDGFRVQVGEELDLRNEARAMVHFRSLEETASLPLVVVPEPVVELSGPNVLTMELLDGVPIDDLSAVASLGVAPGPAIEEVVRAFFLTTVRWGAFHGDIHAGNLLLLRDGRIGVLDWGIVGRLDAETHRFFLRLLAAVLGEEAAWTDVTRHLVKTYGPALQEAVGMTEDQLSDWLRSLVEPMLTRPLGEVSLAALLQATENQVARAQGIEARQRSVRALWRRLRRQRRLRRMAEAAGGLDTDFDRGNFLLTKQLMYFERYGKLFLSDAPILSDRAFFAELLAGARASASADASAGAAVGASAGEGEPGARSE